MGKESIEWMLNIMVHQNFMVDSIIFGKEDLNYFVNGTISANK